MGSGLTPARRTVSNTGRRLSAMVLGVEISDPMSGFFVIRRDLVEQVAPQLATSGFKIQWGSNGYSSLNAWRSAKGQEKLNGVSTGYQGDPKLTNAGHGGTIGNASNLKNLSAYKLRTTSPLINRGVAHPGTLSSVVKTDFFGGSSILGGKHDIGVDEVK